MPRHFLRTVGSLVGVALVVGGCAGLVNPHIPLDATVGKGGAPATLNEVIVYADHAKEQRPQAARPGGRRRAASRGSGAISYMIPAWQLFRAGNYGNTSSDEVWTLVRRP